MGIAEVSDHFRFKPLAKFWNGNAPLDLTVYSGVAPLHIQIIFSNLNSKSCLQDNY